MVGKMKVDFSDDFKARMPTFDDDIRQAVLMFVAHIAKYGLRGLKGRNKSSAPNDPHTKKEQARHNYAQKYCLWHYHIGIPNYVGDDGDMTSQYILHYQRYDDGIVIVDLTTHPPFTLPSQDKLKLFE